MGVNVRHTVSSLTKTFWLGMLSLVIIGRYLPIDRIPGNPLMPFIPSSEFDPESRRLPASNPAGALLNPFLDAMCTAIQPLEDWDDAVQSGSFPGVSGALAVPGRAIRRYFCPDAPPPRSLPELAPPTYPVSPCASSGQVFGSSYVLEDGNWRLVLPFGEVWDCGDNRGFPLEGPTWYPEPGFNREYLGALWSRPVGANYIQGYTPGINRSDDRFRVQIDNISVTPCPGCEVTPIIPQRPVVPQESTPPPVPPRPELPITINLPRLPGLPSLPVPVIYIPIAPTINLNAPITFAPKVDLSPEFNFSPKIELNLGGVSIEGGGYPEPIPDVEVIVENGGNCPDPCEPVDYNLIRSIAIEELDAKFPPTRPFTNEVTSFAAADSGSIELPEFSQWVQITIVEPPRNVREQEGNQFAPNVFYNGWYSFGVTTDAGDRMPIQYNEQSIPVPKGASQFSFTIIGLGTAAIQVGYLDEV